MQIKKDYERIVSIIQNLENKKKHLDSISSCIFLFNKKWHSEAITNEQILLFSQYSLDIDSKFDDLKQKLYGDNKTEF
jgi:hypothetical protein